MNKGYIWFVLGLLLLAFYQSTLKDEAYEQKQEFQDIITALVTDDKQLETELYQFYLKKLTLNEFIEKIEYRNSDIKIFREFSNNYFFVEEAKLLNNKLSGFLVNSNNLNKTAIFRHNNELKLFRLCSEQDSWITIKSYVKTCKDAELEKISQLKNEIREKRKSLKILEKGLLETKGISHDSN